MVAGTNGVRCYVAFACLFLTACAHMGGGDANSSEPITTVAVDPNVVMPARIHYVTNGQAWGQAIGGVVGGAITGVYSPNDSIRSKLEESHVDMGAILVEEMRNALARKSHIRVVDQDADYVVHLTVTDYGFHSTSILSGKMTVLLAIENQVVDKGGSVLFNEGDHEKNQDDTRYSMSEYFSDPSRIQAAFHQVAAQAASDQTRTFVYCVGKLAALREAAQ